MAGVGAEVRIHVASANTNPATELCVRSIHRYAGYPFELVVGDGGSQDGSLEMLRHLAARGWLTLQEENHWHQHADWLDRWLSACEHRYVVFVDSDVAFLHEGWLRDLVEKAQSTDAALVCAEFGAEESNYTTGHARPVRLAARPCAHLLLLDVPQVKNLNVSFASSIEEAEVPEGLIEYDVVSKFFVELQNQGLRYEVMPPEYGAKYRHWGGLSWRSRKLWPDLWPGWETVKKMTRIRSYLRVSRLRWPSPSHLCVNVLNAPLDDARIR